MDSTISHDHETGASTLRLADFVVQYLAAIGVGHVFGVDGANIEDLYDAAHFNRQLTAVLAKHEFSAATMADGYSRSGAGLGVVAATSGGGCLNLVPGLGESLASRVPVLALVGQAPTALDGKGSFQDTSGLGGSLDAVALFSAVSVYCRRIERPAEIVDALPAAIAAARRGGPAVLLLPKDVQQGAVGQPPTFDAPHRSTPRGVDVQELARHLGRVRGPVAIIAGPQVARDDARVELNELGNLLLANVATVPDAKDVVSRGHTETVDTIGVTGVMGHPSVAAGIADSAVCLLVGTRLPVTARAGLEDALTSVETVSIGSEPPFVKSTHVHVDDLRHALRALNTALC